MSQIDLRSLRYFVAVAEERSVSKAARRLHMAQPPLSVQIKNLEAALGTVLFRRGVRGMEITDAGQALYMRAKEAVALATEGVDAARAIGKGHRGRLNVGIMVILSYLMLPRLSKVLPEGLPDVELQYTELNAFSALNAVLDADVSIALSIPPIVAPLVSSRTIGSEPLMAVLREDSQLACQPVLSLGSLDGMARIGLPVIGGSADRSVVALMLREHGVSMPISHRVETATSAMAHVLAGQGCALLPRCARLGCPDGVVFRPLEDESAAMEIAACWRTDLGSPLIDQFVVMVAQAMALRD